MRHGLGFGLSRHRKIGNKPAIFTVIVGTGINEVLVQVSEATTVTPAGGTSIKIGDPSVPGEFVTTPLTLAANTDQEIYFKGAGSFTIPKRKKITKLSIGAPGDSIIICDITGMGLTYLYLGTLRRCLITGDITGMKLTHLNLLDISLIGSSRITGNITGMPLTYLSLQTLDDSVITGDITGKKLTRLILKNLGSSSEITGDISDMELTYLHLQNLGESDITGDISDMELIYLHLNGIHSSGITGDISNMELTSLLLYNIGSSLTYVTNPLNINNSTGRSDGIQIVGDTVFATAAEYERLIHDAATGTWGDGYIFVIESGTNENCPNWDDVKADVATLLTKANWTAIPPTWLEDNGGTWPANWNYYTGDEEDEDPNGELPATFTIPAGFVDTGEKYINFREPVTVTMTGGVTLHIDGTPYLSGEMIYPEAYSFHTLTINNPGQDAGTITFGKRKHITMLYLMNLGSSVITCDITGMGLMVLGLSDIDSSVITGDITGMGLMGLSLVNLGSSVAITGDISDMELMTLMLINLSSSVAITGDITGMGLTYLHLESLSSSSVAITGDITGMELEELVLEDIGLCDITGI